MVEVQANLKAILALQGNDPNLISAKVLASEIWRMYLLPETIRELEPLRDLLSALCVDLSNRRFEESAEKIAALTDLFLRLYLGPMNLPPDKIEEFLQITDRTLSIRLIKIFLEAIKFQIVGRNTISWRDALELLLSFLETYGFKRTCYLQMMLLSHLIMRHDQPKSDFIAKIMPMNEGLAALYIEEWKRSEDDMERISAKRAVKIMLGKVSERIDLGNPLELIKIILICFEDKEFGFEIAIKPMLYQIFFSIGTMRTTHAINALCYFFEIKIENIQESRLFPGKLSLAISKYKWVKESKFIESLKKYIIWNTGVDTSSRYCADRLCLFGRFSDDCFTNDLFIDSTFNNFSQNHFIIVSSSRGYYIADMSSSFVALKADKPLEINVDSVISLGPKIQFKITSIVEGVGHVYVKMMGISRFYMLNTELPIALEKGGKPLEMGRAPTDPRCLINEPTQMIDGKPANLISRKHCEFLWKDSKLFIREFVGADGKPAASAGTYVLLKTYQQYSSNAPSNFFLIENGQSYYSNEMHFKFGLE